MNTNWAENEFGQADLGDQRLNQRLIRLALQRGQAPQASIAQSTKNLAGTRAAYRFYDNQKVTMENILEPHRQATLERLGEEPVVLAVQDTTQIDLTKHPYTQGAGYLQDLEHTGFLLHSTLLVTPKRQPLGLIQQLVWTRDPTDYGKRHKRYQRPTAHKESQKWLTSVQAVAAAQAHVPQTRLVSVGDSEADLYPLFREAHELQVSFLIRAARDRLIGEEQEQHLWRNLAQQPVLGTLEVAIPRQAGRPARTVPLTIRLAAVNLLAPRREPNSSLQQVPAWALLVREAADPDTGERIEWRLITNVETLDFAQACERVAWYSCRWVVEMFHRILKSGCRIEARQFDDLENTKRFLALDSIVAWRVLYLTLTGRQQPEMSCAALLEVYEWQALYCFVKKTRQPPAQAPTLGEVTRWLAELGGFRGSKNIQPGTTVLWQGLQRLSDLSQAWLVFHEDP